MKKADLKRAAERLEEYMRKQLDWNTQTEWYICECCDHRLTSFEEKFCSRCGTERKEQALDPVVMAEIEAALKYALRGIK